MALAWRLAAGKAGIKKCHKELRILLRQSSTASAPARTLVEENDKDLKSLDSELRFVTLLHMAVNEITHTCAECVNFDGMSESQILKSLEDLAKARESRLRKSFEKQSQILKAIEDLVKPRGATKA